MYMLPLSNKDLLIILNIVFSFFLIYLSVWNKEKEEYRYLAFSRLRVHSPPLACREGR
jgi:hypothetical protein